MSLANDHPIKTPFENLSEYLTQIGIPAEKISKAVAKDIREFVEFRINGRGEMLQEVGDVPLVTGDRVLLKGFGSPLMVVRKPVLEGFVECCWFDLENHIQHSTFYSSMLMVLRPAKKEEFNPLSESDEEEAR